MIERHVYLQENTVVRKGGTIEEAIDMAKEAIELYIESIESNNEPVPTEDGTLEYTVTVKAHA